MANKKCCSACMLRQIPLDTMRSRAALERLVEIEEAREARRIAEEKYREWGYTLANPHDWMLRKIKSPSDAVSEVSAPSPACTVPDPVPSAE